MLFFFYFLLLLDILEFTITLPLIRLFRIYRILIVFMYVGEIDYWLGLLIWVLYFLLQLIYDDLFPVVKLVLMKSFASDSLGLRSIKYVWAEFIVLF